ncbi:hypothetical protein TA3x_002590 [Tundrisphaera sp. TA3]|uniref:hypothetical protein n=1 Tax=Tundrisphaera sp. TA3 TaxID=3435775 RepID=UPI003EC0C478
MTRDASDGRKSNRRAFRPTLDGRLESRLLMAAKANVASAFGNARTAAGGQAVVVTLASKERFYISIVNGGTIRATAAPRGRINLIIDGSSIDSLVTINPIVQLGTVQSSNSQSEGSSQQVLDAHTFRTALGNQSRLVNIASIRVSSGTIGAIEGYRTAILSGPVNIKSTNRVDRLAFASVARRGSISVGGDLNTLDILTDADFNTGAGLNVGRDLNNMNVGGNLTFQNGADMTVGRYIGLTAQAAKGSGPAGKGVQVTGDTTIAPGSSLSVGLGFPPNSAFSTSGFLAGVSRIQVGGEPILGTSLLGAFPALGGASI